MTVDACTHVLWYPGRAVGCRAQGTEHRDKSSISQGGTSTQDVGRVGREKEETVRLHMQPVCNQYATNAQPTALPFCA